jgi:hypothetical protein
MAKAAGHDDTLGEFLRRKKGESSSQDIDWNSKKDDWKDSVEQFYRYLTTDLLKNLIDDKTIEVSEVPKQITEEYIGTYTLPELRLKIGNSQVVFSPKGVNVIGATGRIDLRGDRDTVTLIREKTSTGSSHQWQMVSQRVPKVITQPLNSDSLKWALEHVML